MMRIFGHLFLWTGFLSAAFWSVCQLEQEANKWMTVPWGWYAFSMTVGIVGVVMLRAVARSVHADDETTEAEYSAIQQSLDQLVIHVGNLSASDPLPPSEVTRRIDQQCAEPFANFAEARQALTKRFGLQVYADVMTQFASAERYVNRAWSAAADGYVDEMTASIDRANQHLRKTQQLIQTAESAV